MLKRSKLILSPFRFPQNKQVAAEYQVSYSAEEQEFLFFFKTKKTRSHLAGGKERICFSNPWGNSSGCTAWNVCLGCVMVANSQGNVPRQVSYSLLDKQGEKLPCAGSTALEAVGLCYCTIGGRSLVHPTLLVPRLCAGATILTALSAPLSVWLLGSSYTRSAAGGAVMYSCALCGRKSLQTALRCHMFIHQGYQR